MGQLLRLWVGRLDNIRQPPRTGVCTLLCEGPAVHVVGHMVSAAASQPCCCRGEAAQMTNTC